jgi:hypothetical protein
MKQFDIIFQEIKYVQTWRLDLRVFYIELFFDLNKSIPGVLPDYWSVINDLVCPVPESVWQFLPEK